ncbi:rhamnulokinase [bacterium]|nr:rhamnulokinase [bacterium]
MAKDSKFLAFDFGAESGRALLATLESGKLTLDEIHRFPTACVSTLGHMHWDVLRLFDEIKQGLKLALEKTGGKIDGIGVDTWGVDFALLGEDGELLGNPYHYRDVRTDGIPEKLFELVPWEKVFETTGIQLLPFNTLYQLYAMTLDHATALRGASTLLFIPDLFNYWLTGVKSCEFSIASTSQCYDMRTNDWAYGLITKLGIPASIFQKTVEPGTVIGTLSDSLVKELGMGADIKVIAPATHDTGSAVAAVPAKDKDYAYLSSGTWSLMGVETDKPIINDKSRDHGFTNEGGVSGTIRLLHNIMGLWIVQQCRQTWLNAGEQISYAEITDMAAGCEGFVSVVNPNAAVFLTHGDMPSRIQNYCRDSGQKVPETKGEIVRCALDSLALAYRATMEDLDDLLGKKLGKIHIVGGGTQNKLLSQLTADATGRTVIAGPVEATAIGNVLVQAIGTGMVADLGEARQIIRDSFELTTYTPTRSSEIESAYATFRCLSK